MKFLTNNFILSVSTIAAIYRDRRAVESFFRAIKENLELKAFLGTSKNAVMFQIWSALITILIFKYLKETAKEEWSLSGIIFFVRQSVHMHKNLLYLLNHLKDPENSFKKYSKNSYVPPGEEKLELHSGQQKNAYQSYPSSRKKFIWHGFSRS
jgi:putative transposase